MTLEQVVAYALEEVRMAQRESVASKPMLTSGTPPATSHPAGLSDRETEVLRLLAHGMTYAQIAERLILSPHTVNTHLKTIYSKLGVTSRSAATRFAVEHHLI